MPPFLFCRPSFFPQKKEVSRYKAAHKINARKQPGCIKGQPTKYDKQQENQDFCGNKTHLNRRYPFPFVEKMPSFTNSAINKIVRKNNSCHSFIAAFCPADRLIFNVCCQYRAGKAYPQCAGKRNAEMEREMHIHILSWKAPLCKLHNIHCFYCQCIQMFSSISIVMTHSASQEAFFFSSFSLIIWFSW